MKYLLINVPETEILFKDSKISLALPMLPPSSLASLAPILLRKKHKVKILDLRVSQNPFVELKIIIMNFLPDCVGLTFTTPLFKQASTILSYIKKLRKEVIAIAGGSHTSALPIETLQNSNFDIAVTGEGETTLSELADALEKKSSLKKVKGIFFKEFKKNKINIIKTKPRAFIENLDDLPFPSWDLFDLKKYRTPKLSAKKNPVGPLETSRGCVYRCVYCSKCTFGRKFRKKSVKRVVDEMKYMLKCGFGEIHIMDDMFSTDLKRAKKICDEIIRRKLKFPWSLINGIRVDRVDRELLLKLKKAGCYRIAFGVESGDDNILKIINKGITVEQIKRAFKLANDVGVETIAFCMFGLPGETKESMQKTIDLMKEIKPTLPKVSILLPLPNTPIFDEWDSKNLILTKNWERYAFHSSNRVYNHPNLNNEEIMEYYNKFWRELLLSPRFLLRRAIRDLKTGEIFYDIYYFIKTLRFGW